MDNANGNAKIGFFDHHRISGLSYAGTVFLDESIPTALSDCLCRYERAGDLFLPPVAVVHPSYELKECPESLRRIIEAKPDTRFFVTVFTLDDPTARRIEETIGQHDNTTYLLREKAYPKLFDLLEELRSPSRI